MPNFNQWDRVQDQRTVVPRGVYLTMVEGLDAQVSQSGKLMYSGSFRIEAPETHAGELLDERFVVGNDEDPGAEDPETWMSPRNVAAKRMKNLFEAAKLDMSKGVDGLVKAAIRKRVQVMAELEVEPELDRNGQPNRFAGQQRNRIAKFYPVGETVTMATPAVATKAPVRPARPAATQTPAARPAAAPAPAPAPAPRASVPRREPKLVCGQCDAVVPRSEWAAHEASHEGTQSVDTSEE